MKHFGLQVVHHRGSNIVTDEVINYFRSDLKATLASTARMIISNFIRKVGDHRGGHISPIVAYNPETDDLLLLDTNAKRIQPHWIPLRVFVILMCTEDKGSEQPRGYLIVENKVS